MAPPEGSFVRIPPVRCAAVAREGGAAPPPAFLRIAAVPIFLGMLMLLLLTVRKYRRRQEHDGEEDGEGGDGGNERCRQYLQGRRRVEECSGRAYDGDRVEETRRERRRRSHSDVAALPADAQIAIFSHLAPRDLLSFSCASREGRDLLEDRPGGGGGVGGDDGDGGTSSTALLIWKALFVRDFAWILTDWDVGRAAFLRSAAGFRVGYLARHLSAVLSDDDNGNAGGYDASASSDGGNDGWGRPPPSMKDFYFTFSETWLDYTIAGRNNVGDCLVGLHGHAFDISDFVEDHPGSTEMLLLQAGRDATIYFESMGHSLGARKLAMKMCVVVNAPCLRRDGDDVSPLKALGWSAGLHVGRRPRAPPPRGGGGGRRGAGRSARPSPFPCGLILPSDPRLSAALPEFHLLPRKKSGPRTAGGLRRIRDELRRERAAELVRADRWIESTAGPGRDGMFGGANVYRDPFDLNGRGKWRWWYTGLDFDPVFVDPPPPPRQRETGFGGSNRQKAPGAGFSLRFYL